MLEHENSITDNKPYWDKETLKQAEKKYEKMLEEFNKREVKK